MGWRIPANGEKPRGTELQAIEVPISTPTSLKDVDPTTTLYASPWDDLVFNVAIPVGETTHKGVEEDSRKEMDEKTEVVVENKDADSERLRASYHSPRIRFLPDLRPFWHSEAWEKRAALPFGTGYHLFYSRAQEESMKLNKHSGNRVYGDMFLMKLSGDVKEVEEGHKRSFYVDADKDFEWDFYLKRLKVFNLSGLQAIQKKKHFGCFK